MLRPQRALFPEEPVCQVQRFVALRRLCSLGPVANDAIHNPEAPQLVSNRAQVTDDAHESAPHVVRHVMALRRKQIGVNEQVHEAIIEQR